MSASFFHRSPSPSSSLLSVARTHLPSVDSTNSHAKKIAAELNADSLESSKLHVVTADEQTAGRGRTAQRTWVSSKDDLKLTFLFKLRPHELPSAYLLSPLLSIAACDAISASVPSSVKVGIKWPNDLIAGERRKIGGILCEVESVLESQPAATATATTGFWAVLGIGINVNSTPDSLGVARPVWPLSTLKAELASSSSPSALPPDTPALEVKAVEDALVASFNERLKEFRSSSSTAGFPPSLLDDYRRLSVLIGRRVVFSDGSGHGASGGPGPDISGVVVDISNQGALVIIDLDGRRKEFLSGEVTGLRLEDE